MQTGRLARERPANRLEGPHEDEVEARRHQQVQVSELPARCGVDQKAPDFRRGKASMESNQVGTVKASVRPL